MADICELLADLLAAVRPLLSGSTTVALENGFVEITLTRDEFKAIVEAVRKAEGKP